MKLSVPRIPKYWLSDKDFKSEIKVNIPEMSGKYKFSTTKNRNYEKESNKILELKNTIVVMIKSMNELSNKWK